jgi:hypothetical protein
MNLTDLKQAPAWILFLLIGVILVVLGASQSVTLAGNTIQLASPYNLIVLGIGAIFIIVGIVEFIRNKVSSSNPELPVKKININSIDVRESGDYPRVCIVGKVTPPVQGVHVWILREHEAKKPGRFHIGGEPALTDKNGEWRQYTNLWRGGSFRLHAVVANPNTEILFAYYREAFEHARKVYRESTDKNAPTFPGWPNLRLLPSECVSDYQVIVV